jgi:hypothetical protein
MLAAAALRRLYGGSLPPVVSTLSIRMPGERWRTTQRSGPPLLQSVTRALGSGGMYQGHAPSKR